MNVTTAYMYSVRPLANMFEAIQKAQVPPRFTHQFLLSLGFKSTNDRAFINVLKGLGFLDSNSTPTQVYRDYRDKARAKRVLGTQIKKAYEGLFMANEKAQDLSVDDIKGKLASISGKDESVAQKMASTFKALVPLADFSGELPAESPKEQEGEQEAALESPALQRGPPVLPGLAFSHVIYINLPTTKDVAVYDAIFKSIREHLA